jgi:hypothetical protein
MEVAVMDARVEWMEVAVMDARVQWMEVARKICVVAGYFLGSMFDGQHLDNLRFLKENRKYKKS